MRVSLFLSPWRGYRKFVGTKHTDHSWFSIRCWWLGRLVLLTYEDKP